MGFGGEVGEGGEGVERRGAAEEEGHCWNGWSGEYEGVVGCG